MPRFYFHVSDASGYSPDFDGAELVDSDAARAVAVRGAREIMAADIRDGELDLSPCITVEYEAGVHAFTLNFEDAVSVIGGRRAG